jgi:PAS domain S-box-containing protein
VKNHKFEHQIDTAQERLRELVQQIDQPDADSRALVETAVEQLSNSLEELHVAQEELRQQNEELLATRKELEAERQRYQELFSFAPDGYLVTNAEGMIQEANRAVSALLGLRQDYLIGKPLVIFVPEAERVAYYAFLKRLRTACDADHEPWKTRLQPREGQPFHTALSVAPVCNAPDEVTGLRWLVRDRSESQKLIEANRRQRRFLEQLMDVAPVGIAVVRGEEHRFEMANAYYRAIPGAEPPIVGRTFAEVFGEVSHEESLKVITEIYETGEPLGVRERRGAYLPDEGYTYWNVDLVPLWDARDEVGEVDEVDGVLIVVHDVSQAVRARKEIERLAGEVHREREKMTTVMENTHAQLAYLDADFNFVHVNTAYASGSGVPKEELIGHNHFDLFPDAENRAIFEQVVTTGEAVTFQGRPFVLPNAHEQEITYWDWSLVPVKDPSGEVTGLVLSLLDVTERERLMRQLDVEQARLNTIIKSMPAGVVFADEAARILLTNQAAEEMVGHPVPFGENYESHEGLRLCYPDGRPYEPRDLPLTRAALDGEGCSNLELAVIKPGGEQRDLLASTAPIRSSEGRLTGAVGVFRDITERKQMEEDLRERTELLRMLHDLDQVILMVDSAEKIAEAALSRLRDLMGCQRASVELFDFEAEEAVLLAVDVQGATRLAQGQRLPLTWNRPVRHLEAGEIYVIEDLDAVTPSAGIEILRAEGVRSFVSLPLRAEGELMGALNLGLAAPGGPAEKLWFIMEDVARQIAIGIRQTRLQSELRAYADELERRVARRTAELAASEARFRAIFEQSALGIALLDKKGRVIAANPALEEMLGQDEATLQEQRFIDFAHPDENITEDVAIYREIQAGERDYHRMEVRYLGPENQIGWANIVFSLVRDGDNTPEFIVAIVEDVTERKEAQQALIQSEKLATTGRLAASLAHEINNPLQTVIGCLGLAHEIILEEVEGDTDDEMENYVAIAREELKRAADIVSRLRDVGRPHDPEPGHPTDLHHLLDQVLKVSNENLKNRGVRVVRAFAQDLPQPVVVADRLKQVFLNLVLNASDAMLDGGTLTVRTRYEAERGEILVQFIDEGGGIPEGMLNHLFDPFFSTKEEGTGLGLFVSQNIMQEQGGRIEVESTLGEGSTFTVVLPAPPP